MSALSVLVDILIAAFILHEIGWIDVSLPDPILYRGGDSAIERSSPRMEGTIEGLQREMAPQGADSTNGSPLIIEAKPAESLESDG